MKKLLMISLLALPAAALAAEPGPRECRVLAADEWVAMGVTSLAGCIRYTEAAATPDEAQYAQFGALSLMVRDGQYFQSNDGAGNWRRIQPFSSSPALSTLNSLQTPTAPEKSAKDDSKAKPEVAAPAPAPVPTPEPVIAADTPTRTPVQAPVRVRRPAPAPPVQVQAAEVPSIPLPAPLPSERVAVQQIEPVSEGSLRPCQIKIYQEWQATPAESLQRCAELVYAKMSTSRRTQANGYWDGMYLVVSQNSIFKSRNGQDWTPLKE